MSSNLRIVLVAAALLLVGGIAAAPTAQACGFDWSETVGPVEYGMQCTMPYVEVHEDEIYPLLP